MINKRFDDINFDIEIYSNEYDCALRVIDYPNIRKRVYYINDDGTVIYSKLQRNKYLKTAIDSDGYLKVTLQAENCDKSIGVEVHRLVMFTFGTKPPSNMIDPTIDHIDNNRLNNHISNLQWLERRDNSLKATTNLKGNNNPRHIISENIAKAIISDLQQGILNCKQIAKKFNVSYDIVTNIKHGNSWTYLTKDLGFVTRFKSKSVSDEMRLEIAKDIASGDFTNKQICEKYGVTLDIVRNIKNKRGVNDNELLKDFTFDITKYNRLDRSLIHEIKLKMITTNARNCDIMRMYGVSKSKVESIRHWLRDHPEFTQQCFNEAKQMSPTIHQMPSYIYPISLISTTDSSVGVDPYGLIDRTLPIVEREHKDYVFDSNSKFVTPFD